MNRQSSATEVFFHDCMGKPYFTNYTYIKREKLFLNWKF